jgi:phosphoglycerol transferase MdoB-like AlkP superfamily enzyme
MTLFLWGACATASAVIALFFWKFYGRTRDRLLAMFALAFAVLATHWFGLAVVQPDEEIRHWFYILRLVAFLLIIAGIVEKNRAHSRG